MRRVVISFVLLGVLCFFGSLAPAREWTSGKFKVEGDLVAVRNGKAIIEKTDGSIISVALDKLSEADREYIKSQNQPAPAAPVAPAAPIATEGQPVASATPAKSATPVTAEGAAIAARVQAVFKTNCHRCHGEEGASEGGFNYSLNLQKLAQTLVKPRNASGSTIYQRITATDDRAMPPDGESPRPSAVDIATIKSWIDAGAPAPSDEKPRELITNDAVTEMIANNVQESGERSRRFLRYFTLTHLYNAGVPEDELQTYRNAFFKLINSLSWNTKLITPATIDPAKTIFRIDMRELQWNSQMWEQVEAANPYFLDLEIKPAQAAREATQTRMYSVRADWFVFAACKPPLYHVMLGLPETAGELENLLRVNAAANIEQEQAIRAAFNRSGVSQNNRLIEWHKSPYGSYWKSYDFGGNAGRQNLFEYPLGPGAGDGNFQHDGGELIFTLPNGLQGYLLVNRDGQRIDNGPTNIVSDPKRPNRMVTNGVSCMSCHYTGVITKADEVGPAVRANRKAFKNSEQILALYREPAELAAILDEDAKRFAGAMRKLGVSSLSRSGEPVSAMAQCFEQELDLRLAACEFGLSSDELLKRLDGSDMMSRRFAALRTPGGVIKRDVFATGYGEAAVELKLVKSSAAALAGRRAMPPGQTSGKRDDASQATGSKPGEVCRIDEPRSTVKSIAFSPNGSLLGAGKMDRALKLYDVATQGQCDAREKLDSLHSVESCAFSPSGARFLAGGDSGLILVYEVARDNQLKEIGQFAGHSKGVNCMAVSPDGQFALSGDDDKKVRCWKVDSGEDLGNFPELKAPVKACCIPRTGGHKGLVTDGQSVLEIGLNANPTVTRNRQLGRSRTTAQAVAFSNDGLFLAVSEGSDIRIWNVNTGKELPKLEAKDIQWSLAFTPDGSRLLSGAHNSVNVWDFHKARRVHTLDAPEAGYVHCLAASADSKLVAVVGRNCIHVFKVASGP